MFIVSCIACCMRVDAKEYELTYSNDKDKADINAICTELVHQVNFLVLLIVVEIG